MNIQDILNQALGIQSEVNSLVSSMQALAAVPIPPASDPVASIEIKTQSGVVEEFVPKA